MRLVERPTAGSFRRAATLATVAILVVGSGVPSGRGMGPPAAAAATVPPLPWYCVGWRDAQRRADELLVGRYQLHTHPVVELGLDPNWREDPLRNANWTFLHHSLEAVLSLLQAYAATGDRRYLDRGAFLLRDWHRSNPRYGAPSPWAWNDHSTALRAVVFACAATYIQGAAWLNDALLLHGRTLADPDFYVKHGNHALNQALGLLEVGVALRRGDWPRLAADRINRLVAESVDAQGVTNEQAMGYQSYNYTRYSRALRRLTERRLPLGAAFDRVPRMPAVLAHATVPNGTLETIGDTDPGRTPAIPGTWAEFASTQGQRGRKPGDTVALYHAGYLFARSGWGERRRFADETFLSLRWGPAPYIHGHADHGAITLYAFGARLLLDPGRFTYNRDAWRTFFKSRQAHNVVTVDASRWNWGAASRLLKHIRTSTLIDATVQMSGDAGVTHRRHVTFSRNLHYLLVEDRLLSQSPHTYRQLWHLAPDANPFVRATWFRTQRRTGNVQVQQLLGGSTSRVVTGQTSPIQGWIALAFMQKKAAPVVQVIRGGRNVRFLTLIVAAPGQPQAKVSALRVTRGGYSVVVTIGGRSERVTVDGTSASIVPLP